MLTLLFKGEGKKGKQTNKIQLKSLTRGDHAAQSLAGKHDHTS